MRTPGHGERRLLSIVDGERLRRVLRVMLDEREFLSPYGIRALSQVHREQPYVLDVDGTSTASTTSRANRRTGLFGGNSNWRGPIWFPVNFLLIEALQKFHHYFGDDFKVECPTGSGQMMTLWEVAAELSRRLSRIFLRDEHGRRPVFGGDRAVPDAIRTGATWCRSTSTSTATPAPASAPAIRPAGPRWSPSCCSRAENSMKAIAVLPGQPDSVHLAELAEAVGV